MNLESFSTIQEVHAEPVVTHVEFSSNRMTSFLLKFGLLDEVLNATSGLLRGFKIRLETVSVFDFREDSADGLENIALLDYIISTSEDTAQNEYLKTRYAHLRDELVRKANVTTYPYTNVTQAQLNEAKGVYSEQPVLGFVRGRDIKITFNSTLPESCKASTWVVEPEFSDLNYGKYAHLNTTDTVYKLRTDNKEAEAELRVRVPFPNVDFTVELI